MHITTRGLVLREVKYKEADKILTILTPDGGKCTVKARGCCRKGSPLAASAQLLVYSDMTLFAYRDYFTLNEASSLQQFWGVKSDVEKLALGSYFAEVMEAVAEEGRGEEALLSLILNALYALDQLHKPLAQVKAAFELRLLCLMGYEPMLEGCGICGREEPEAPRLSLRQGLLHCARCRGMEAGWGVSMPLSPAALSAGRYLLACPPKKFLSFSLDEESLGLLGDTTEAFLMTQLERGFRTLDYYKQLF